MTGQARTFDNRSVTDATTFTLAHDDDPSGTIDPYRRIAEIVRASLPAETADPMLERISEALETVVPAHWDLLALENARLQHELESQASADRLTGLRNRHRFFEDLRREYAAARRYHDPLTLLVLDVDGLKNVNESSGFDAGDKLLLAIADTLMTKIRITDIAARVGDDDFAIILPRTPHEGARRLSERLSEALGGWVHIGVAALNGDVTSGADLLERADRDLAERKHAARAAATVSPAQG